ncbi:FxLYD domain-containing protein [Streptomyces sp. NEAU-NA10]|uniref:FxLYD domain-containing protein n=1 Tax=Streptomyces sp. NEAU-NA10 TaxID=3416050 RepID=UPI003CC58D02
MAAHRTHWATTAALTATACALLLSGCSDDTAPSSVASRAASAAESVGERAADAFASATAEVGRQLDSIKGGVEAKDDVKLGSPSTDADGRGTVEVTATNSADSTKSFAVQVNFRDANGNWQDTVLVTVPDVPAGKSKPATARSTRKVSGEIRAEVGRAVRY